MATNTSSFAFNAGTDALWRTLITNIAATFTAGGLVQTSDTGQINLSTVLFPTSASTYSGYQMFRFNDSLQSTLPIFMRVAYWRGVSSSAIRLDISFGTATDGAGVLSGQLSAVQTMYMTGNAAAQNCYTSGDGSRFVTGWGWPAPNSYNAGILIQIERLRDANGANTADGFAVFLNQSSSSTGGLPVTFHQVIPASGIVWTQIAAQPCWPWPGQSQATGGDLYLTAFSPRSNQLHNPCTSLLKYWLSDLGTLSEFGVQMYSSSINFKALGNAANSAIAGPSSYPNSMLAAVANPQNNGFAIRWE